MKNLLSLLALGALIAFLPCATAHAEGNGQGGGQRGGRGGRRAPPSVEQIFERFDANEDGVLTAEEVPERAWKRIGEADADGNGEVTEAELQAHIDARKGKRGGRRGGGSGQNNG